MTTPLRPGFWRDTPLADMTQAEWEAVCDGCGKCCLHKLEDADTGHIVHTEVACRYLDVRTCTCTEYERRGTVNPECVQLTPDEAATLRWLPPTCAYRLLARGEPLPWWHPLVAGDEQAVHRAGASVCGHGMAEPGLLATLRAAWSGGRRRALREDEAGDLEDHIVDWPEDETVDDFPPPDDGEGGA